MIHVYIFTCLYLTNKLFYIMKMLNYKVLSVLALLTMMVACNSDQIEDIPIELTHDIRLVGNWAKQTNVLDYLVDEMNLFEDGTGNYINSETPGTLKWGVHKVDEESYLKLELDNGIVNDVKYDFTGALMTLNSQENYLLDFPILGEWYLAELNQTNQQIYNCAYTFYPTGTVACKYFDNTGIVYSKNETWYRNANGELIILIGSMDKKLSYQIKNQVLTVEDGNTFVRDNKWYFYGEWTSIYNEKGKIEVDQYPYNTLSINRWLDDKNHIHIHHITDQGYNRRDEFIWSDHNGNLLYLVNDSDGYMLNYRYKYDFTTKQFYLELSEEDKQSFKQYVGYCKVDNN